MRAIMVMYDSLNRRFLKTYNAKAGADTPNFTRLATRTAKYTNCYVGSMPCMPARRELHTGRYNFLHAPWGLFEPFDDSMPKMLDQKGVHTHLVTDHYHYFENNGCNYHCQYSTWESVRGQEGDTYFADINCELPPTKNKRKFPHIDLAKQDMINRQLWKNDETQRPMNKTFNLGLEFLERNKDDDDWFLSIETFDPHEPFDAPSRLVKKYDPDYTGPIHDWDNYGPVTESQAEIDHLRACYMALVEYCDEQLGRVIDFMDENNMWKDTMLIVCTDHGHMLSEKGFWAKNYMPLYNEIANTPLFVWDPRHPLVKGQIRDSLVQTIDIPVTLLNYFNVEKTANMGGNSIAKTQKDDRQTRESGLFGYFGSMTCLIYGDYIYMRASNTKDNKPLNMYTWHLNNLSSYDGEKPLDYKSFDFTKGLDVPKISIKREISRFKTENLLFNIKNDPEQEHPINNMEIENEMIKRMKDMMIENDAPPEQFIRLGLN